MLRYSPLWVFGLFRVMGRDIVYFCSSVISPYTIHIVYKFLVAASFQIVAFCSAIFSRLSKFRLEVHWYVSPTAPPSAYKTACCQDLNTAAWWLQDRECKVFREFQVSSAAVAENCQCPKVACQFCLPDDIIITTNKLSCHNDGRVNSTTDGLWARSGVDRLNIRKFCHEERTTREMILITAATSIPRKIIREIR